MGTLMPGCDTTIVAIGVSTLMDAFGVGTTEIQWVSTAYTLALAIGIPVAGRLERRRADAVCPVAAVQNRYSMMARWHESLFPALEELNVALVAFSPMANGFLTGAYGARTTFEGAQDHRVGMPQYTEEGERRARPLMAFVHELAGVHGATPAQVSLAWMLRKKPWIVPIPGSRKPERLRENLGAADVELTADEVARIDELLGGLDLMVFGGHAVVS